MVVVAEAEVESAAHEFVIRGSDLKAVFEM